MSAEQTSRKAHDRWIDSDSDEDFYAWQEANKAFVEHRANVTQAYRSLVERRVSEGQGVR